MSLRDSRRLPGLSTLLTIVIAAATLLVTGLMAVSYTHLTLPTTPYV